MRRTAALLAGLAASLLLLTPIPASAHADLLRMDPAAGSTIQSAPQQVALTFSEPVQDLGSTVVVLSPTGQAVQSGPATMQGQVATVPLQPLREAGAYHVNFRIVSGDGHVVSDSLVFTYQPGVGTSTTSTDNPNYAASPAPEVSAVTHDSATAAYWMTGFLMLFGVVIAGAAWLRRR